MRGCACRGTAGFVHVSCLAEQAKVLMDEAEQNNLREAFREAGKRWYVCSLCEQRYHGVVACALGWASWKMFLGRPKEDGVRCSAMEQLGNGLHDGGHYEDALSVREAELAMVRRLGAPVCNILVSMNNIACTYHMLGRDEEALSMRRDVYSGHLKLHGEEDEDTLVAANNYADTLRCLRRFEEAKSLLRKTMPVARRVLSENQELTLRMRWIYAKVLRDDEGATRDDLREAVTTLEDTARTAQRVFGGAHPMVVDLERSLRESRAALSARGGTG